MIFLGAGASAPFNIPTSPVLTQQMENILDEEFLKDIKNFLKINGKDYTFENVLTILQVLTNQLEVSRNHYTQLFPINYPNRKKDYTSLINKMYEILCNCCTGPFLKENDKHIDPEKLEKIFDLTYDILIGISLKKQLRQIIFSTNYDPSVEIWCHRRFLNCFDGTRDVYNPDFKQQLKQGYLLNQIDKINMNDQETVPLVRLHGSILSFETQNNKAIKFVKSKDMLNYKDLYDDKLKLFPTLIFPGQEEKIRSGEWNQYHQLFREKLSEFSLFIGYSFRHDELNEPILRALDSNQIVKLGVLNRNPDENLKNLFRGRSIPDDKIIKMPAEFGTIKAIEEINNNWFPLIFGKKYEEIKDILQEIKEWKKERLELYL
jgi:hypothetical protein